MSDHKSRGEAAHSSEADRKLQAVERVQRTQSIIERIRELGVQVAERYSDALVEPEVWRPVVVPISSRPHKLVKCAGVGDQIEYSLGDDLPPTREHLRGFGVPLPMRALIPEEGGNRMGIPRVYGVFNQGRDMVGVLLGRAVVEGIADDLDLPPIFPQLPKRLQP